MIEQFFREPETSQELATAISRIAATLYCDYPSESENSQRSWILSNAVPAKYTAYSTPNGVDVYLEFGPQYPTPHKEFKIEVSTLEKEKNDIERISEATIDSTYEEVRPQKRACEELTQLHDILLCGLAKARVPGSAASSEQQFGEIVLNTALDMYSRDMYKTPETLTEAICDS